MASHLGREGASPPMGGVWLPILVVALALLSLPPAATAQPQTASDDYSLAIGLYKQQRWSLAAESFRKFLKANPRHEKAAAAKLYLGLTLVNLTTYDDAREILRDYVKQFPNSDQLSDALYRVAECSYFLDETQTAETEFETFLKRYPRDDLVQWALPYLGDCQLRLNKPREAAESFRKSLELFPEGPLAEDSRFGSARCFELLGEASKAAEIYKQIASDETGTRGAQAQLNLATLQFDAERFAEAADAYTDVEKRFPDSKLVPLARLNAGYAYYQLGDYRNAIAQFERSADDPQQSTTAGYWQGVAYKALGELDRATAVLKATYQSGRQTAMADRLLYQWADCELRRENYAEARRLFLQLADSRPDADLADDSLHFAAEAALLAGELEAAEKLLERFGERYGESPLRFFHAILRGRLLAAKGGDGNLNQAIAVLQRVLDESELEQTRSAARFQLARVLQEKGDDRRAVQVVRPLIEDVKKQGGEAPFVDALVLAGNSLLAQEQFEEAAEAVSQYLRLRPQGEQFDQALSARMLAYAHLGRKDEARSDLHALSKKMPGSPLVAETAYQAAEIAYEKKDWPWSAELFAAVAEITPKSAHHAAALSGLAWSQYQQEHYVQAAETFARVAESDADDSVLAPEAAYKRAESLQKANRHAKAAEAYQKAFEKFAPTKGAPADAEKQGRGYYAYRAGLQAARMLRKLGEVDASHAAYETLLERFPKPARLDKLLDEWALLNYEAGEFERADAIFRRLVKETPNSDLVDDARLSLAESDFIAGRLDEAKKTFRELHSSPNSEDSLQEIALKHLVEIAVEQRDWRQVESTAEQFLERFEQSQHRPDVRFRLAEARLHIGNIEAAQQELINLMQRTAEPAVAEAGWLPRIWILLAEIAFRQRKYGETARLVEELRETHPDSSLLYQADEILGRSYKNQARFDEARKAFARVVDDEHGRRTETAAKSQFLLAETYLLQKRYRDAQREYLKVYHLYKYPEWQAPALYQAAQCDEALGQWGSAVKAYEDLLQQFSDSEFAAKAKPRLQVARQKAAS